MHPREIGPPKTLPCRYFSGDGKPIKGGCNRSRKDCHFIHPSDKEWDDYFPSDKFERDRERSRSDDSPPRDRHRSRSRSPPRRHRSSPRPSYSRSPMSESRGRQSSIDSDRKSSLPPGTPTAPRTKPRHSSAERMPPPPVDLTRSISYKSQSEGKTKNPAAETTPRPPVSSPPPIPIPDPSLLLSKISDKRLPGESFLGTSAEHKKILKDKMKELGRCIEINRRSQQIDAEIDDMKQMQSKMEGLPDHDKKRFNAAIQKLEEKKKKLTQTDLQSSVARVHELNPFPDKESTTQRSELIGHVRKLTEKLGDIKQALDRARVKDGTENNAMSVDPPAGFPPVSSADTSRKRRRVDNDAMDVDDASGLSQDDFEGLKAEVERAESDIALLNNNLINYRDEIADDSTEIMKSHFDDYVRRRHSEGEPGWVMTRGQIQDKVNEATKTVDSLVADVKKLNESVFPDLEKEVSEREGKLKEVVEASSRADSEIEKLKIRLKELEDARLDHAKRYKVLETAIDAYAANSSPTSPPAPLLPAKFIIDSLERPINEAIQASIERRIESWQRQTRELVDSKTQDIYQGLLEKTNVLRKTSDLIAQRLQSGAVQT